MKTKLLFLFSIVLFASCNPANTQNPPTNDSANGDTIWDDSALTGKWHPYNYYYTYIFEDYTYIFEDGVIYEQYKDNEPEMTHLYTNYGNVLHLERLYLEETNPARCADCKYRINGDTLFIEKFSITISSIYPPDFHNSTLIKVKE